MFKAFIQIVAMAALALVCGTGYNLWNKGSPRYLPWQDERLKGMDFLTSAPAQTKNVTPPPTNPAPTSPPEDAKKPGDPLPANPPLSKEKEGPAAVLPQPTAKASEPPKEAAPASEFPMIDIAAAHEEYRNETLFIDARRTREYEAGHITGALTASAWEADLLEKITKVREEYPAEAPVVVYCGSSKECEDSKIVSRQLKEVGFVNILVYQGGFPEWSKEKPDLVTKGLEPGKREVP
jgi:rhodanese-related sulfurtransferase